MEKKIMINDRLILNVQANEFWYKTRTKDKHYTIQKTEHLLAKLLEILAENAGSVIHREAFISKIWYGNDNVGNPALTKAVSKLRKLLQRYRSSGLKLHCLKPKTGLIPGSGR